MEIGRGCCIARADRLVAATPFSSTLLEKYTFDAVANLLSKTDRKDQTLDYTYDPLNRLTQTTYPDQSTTSFTYDNLSRLLSVLHQIGGNTVDGASYSVDAVGNRTSKLNHLNSETSNYTYDQIYQLTQVVIGGNSTESYSYDAVGNRLSSLGVSPYTYNISNQLSSTPSASFTYDDNGNTATKTEGTDTTSYEWDFENRLVSVTLPDQSVVSFSYDPFGRRIRKVASATTIFVYDGANTLEEVNDSGGVLARYTQGLAVDEPLAMLRGGTTHYYQADGLGSITGLGDPTGTLGATYTYDSFGILSASTGSLTNPFRFTARESDSEIDLYFYRARYYTQEFGRFVSEDPLGFQSGTNWFSYVQNNPVVLTDPSGLLAFGLGLGLNGVFSMPKGGGVGEAGCTGVVDLKGNVGLLCCYGPGFSAGPAVALTGEVEGIFCPACKTICDLEGTYIKLKGFGGAKAAASGGGGVSVGTESLVFHGSGGVGIGGGGGVGVIIGECKLVLGGSRCKQCDPEKDD